MQISAFVDGELPESEQELLLRRLSQDAELREQVAEFLAIGRAMRGEVQVAGLGRLRDRIAVELDEKPLQEHDDAATPRRAGYAKPLAGFAMAATVAVVAIIGLQQFSADDGTAIAPAETVVDTAFPTQPEITDLSEATDVLEQYRMLHEAQSSELGANNIKARLTSVELGQENAVLSEDAAEDEEAGVDGEAEGDEIE